MATACLWVNGSCSSLFIATTTLTSAGNNPSNVSVGSVLPVLAEPLLFVDIGGWVPILALELNFATRRVE